MIYLYLHVGLPLIFCNQMIMFSNVVNRCDILSKYIFIFIGLLITLKQTSRHFHALMAKYIALLVTERNCFFSCMLYSWEKPILELMGSTIQQYTLNIDPDPTLAIDENAIKQNMKTIHTTIVQDHLNNRPINKLLNRPPPDIDKKEETLPHSTRCKLSQLRTNKSPFLMTYLHKIDPANHPAANCPLCNDPNHDSLHLFNCPDIQTTLTVWDFWTDPVGVAALLDVWGEKLGGPRAGV